MSRDTPTTTQNHAMAHNAEAGGSGVGGTLRSLQLTYDEADVLYWQRIPVPLQFKLPHGWHLSNAGYAVPSPPPPGPETRALIAERRAHMAPAERSLPENAQNSPAWPWWFQDERDIELARSAGRFNRVGRWAWWQGCDVGVPTFFPQAQCMAPEAAGKDDGIGQLALGLVDGVGRAGASFGRRRHPRQPKACSFGSGSEDAGDAPTPPSQGRVCGLSTTSAGEEDVVGDRGGGAGGL